MKDVLLDIREKLNDGAYTNEEHVRLSLVARVLQQLGWDLWNPREVNSEFRVLPQEDSSRVDLALFLTPYSPEVFLEVKLVGKLTGNIGKVEGQLRDYNRNNTALFSIITDGQKWLFYYSQTGGQFSQKRFKTLDILADEVDDLQMFFDMFLSKKGIGNGSAERQAKDYLQLSRKQRVMEDVLPEAKRRVNQPPFPTLPQAVVTLAQEAGHSVTIEEASQFIEGGIAQDTAESASQPIAEGDAIHAKETPHDVKNMEPQYVTNYRKQLRNPNNLISKIKSYIDQKGVVTGDEIKRVCVREFACADETSGSIAASLKTLEWDGLIKVEGRGHNKRMSSMRPHGREPA